MRQKIWCHWYWVSFKNYTYFRSKYYENPFYKYKFYLINKKKRTLGFFVGRVCVHKGNKALRFVEFFLSLTDNHIVSHIIPFCLVLKFASFLMIPIQDNILFFDFDITKL